VRFLLHRGRLRILQILNTLELGLSLLQSSVQQLQFLFCWSDFIPNIFCLNVYTLMTARAPSPYNILRLWHMFRCYHSGPGKEKVLSTPCFFHWHVLLHWSFVLLQIRVFAYIVSTLLPIWVLSWTMVSETRNGVGTHIWDVPVDKYMTFFKVCLMWIFHRSCKLTGLC